MRPIKFRAWVVDEYEEDGNTPATFKMHYWFPEFFSDMSPVTRWGSDFPDDPEMVELMQYTGLKDKNGVEIYEGDIIKCVDVAAWVDIESYPDEVLPVKWSEKLLSYVPYMLVSEDYEVEVIGNIYENPEL